MPQLRALYGIAYRVVPSDQAQTHIPLEAAANPTRELWSHPAIKYSESDFKSREWVNVPIRDTHGDETIGRITSAELVKHDIYITAILTDETEAGARAIQAFDRGERLALSVNYAAPILAAGRVGRKPPPKEVSICYEPHFPECRVLVAASRSRQTSEPRPYISWDPQPQTKREQRYIIEIMSSSPQAPSDQQQPAAEESNTESPPPPPQAEGEKPSSLESITPQLRALAEENERLRKMAEESKSQTEELQMLRKEREERERSRQEKALEQIQPFLNEIQPIVESDTLNALQYVATDPKHEDSMRKLGEVFVAASKERDEVKNKLSEIENEWRSLQQGNLRSNPGMRQAALDDSLARFGSVFSNPSGAQNMFTPGYRPLPAQVIVSASAEKKTTEGTPAATPTAAPARPVNPYTALAQKSSYNGSQFSLNAQPAYGSTF